MPFKIKELNLLTCIESVKSVGRTLVNCLLMRQKMYFCGGEDRHQYGIGFLIYKDMLSAVLGRRPICSRLISIRLRVAPFNVTIIQVYSSASGHDGDETGNLNKTPGNH